MFVTLAVAVGDPAAVGNSVTVGTIEKPLHCLTGIFMLGAIWGDSVAAGIIAKVLHCLTGIFMSGAIWGDSGAGKTVVAVTKAALVRKMARIRRAAVCMFCRSTSPLSNIVSESSET